MSYNKNNSLRKLTQLANELLELSSFFKSKSVKNQIKNCIFNLEELSKVIQKDIKIDKIENDKKRIIKKKEEDDA